MKSKLLTTFYFARAFLVNAYVEFQFSRIENAKRKWVAYRVGGGGVVPLGKCNQETALAKATKLGNVSFVDPEHAVIFYSVN